MSRCDWLVWYSIYYKNCGFFSVHWLDHDKTLREQGVDDSHTVLLRFLHIFVEFHVHITVFNFTCGILNLTLKSGFL